MHMTVDLLFIAFNTWLYRWRGGGWPHVDLPGGPAVAPSFVMGMTTFLLFWLPYGLMTAWHFAVVFGAGYLIANMMGHGAYMDIGTWVDGYGEKEIWFIDKIVRPSLGYGWEGDAASLFLYHLFALPLFVASIFVLGATAWQALAAWLFLATFSVLAYAMFMRLLVGHLSRSREWAEWAKGAIWGLALVGIAP